MEGMSGDAADDDIVARVLAGDIEAYALLVECHERDLRSWLASRCPRQVDEVEIAQRAFVKAYENLHAYQPGRSFRGWLFGIARHLLLAECKQVRVRSESARHYVDVVIAQLQEQAVEAADPEADLRLAGLRRCLERLPEAARQLLERRYARKETMAAIADALGRSTVAVRKHLHLIRRKLHDCIERGREPA